MSPQKSKLSSWASGGEQDTQVRARSKRLTQWVSGESAPQAKARPSLIRRLTEWASGGETAAQPAAVKPTNVPPVSASPAAPPKPRPASAPLKPAVAGLDSANADQLAGQLADLQGDLALTDLNNQIQRARRELESSVAGLRDCRARGYIFHKELETSAAALEKQAVELRARFEEQVRTLKAEADEMETLLAQGASTARGALAVLHTKVTAAAGVLQGDCATLNQRVAEIALAVKKIAWAINQLEQASFRLTATEALVDATQAVWKNSSNTGEVKGILYLTDLRLILERKEEKVTRKILFVATATETQQDLVWEAPLQLVEKAVGSQQGLLGMREQLVIAFASGGPYPQVTLSLDGTDESVVSSSAWAALIGRVKSGVIAQDRTTPLDPEAAAASRLPSHCPSCGAVFTQTVLRGQSEFDCQYCGLKVRL